MTEEIGIIAVRDLDGIHLHTKEYKGRQILLRNDGWKEDESFDDEIFKDVLLKDSYGKKVAIEKGDIWLDIGGHIGLFNIRCWSSEARAVSYEPEPQNFLLLSKNIEGIGTAVNKAVVGNEDEFRRFYANRDSGKSSFYCNKTLKLFSNVSCININDALTDEFNSMKLDCEGSELEILRDIKSFHNVRKIVLEYHQDKRWGLGRDGYYEIVSILEKNGFVVDYNKDIKKNWTLKISGVR